MNKFNNIVVPEATNEILATVDITTVAEFSIGITNEKIGDIIAVIKVTRAPLAWAVEQFGHYQDHLLANIDATVANMIRTDSATMGLSFGWTKSKLNLTFDITLKIAKQKPKPKS